MERALTKCVADADTMRELLVKLDRRSVHRVALLCGLLLLPLACSSEDRTNPAPATGPAGAATSTTGSEDKAPASSPSTASPDKPYTVDCGGKDPETGEKRCIVDRATYVGWRTFNSVCYVCHGQDAVGTTFAPSLVERLQLIDKDRFMYVVNNGFQGQIGVMPAWKDNPNVNKHFEELYSYIKARADGALPRGRPEWKPE
jgi:hypothetical protein